MTTRKRIRTFQHASASGGGVPPPPINVEWTVDPDPNNIARIVMGASIPEFDLMLQNPVALAAAIAEFDALLGANAVSIADSIDKFETAFQNNVGITIPALTFRVQTLPTSKDSWVDNVALCPTDVNHNGTEIQLNGVVATRKDGLIGFDLSGFPAASTVTAASLLLTLQTAPVVTNGSLEVFSILAAGEGWSETAVKCSTTPATNHILNAATAIATTDAVGTVYTIALASLGDITARMGTSSFTCSLKANDASTAGYKFYDKEDILNHPAQLDLTFTVP